MAIMIQAVPRVERRRPKSTSTDILANIFLVAWISVVLQGALRKWVFPGMEALYLVQDLPLLIAYVYGLYKGIYWSGWLAMTCLIGAILISIETMLQIIFIDSSLKVSVIGLHQYIFYLPILFMAPVCYNLKHRLRFLRCNLLSTLPIALIAVLQSRSPRGAWINRTTAGGDGAFGLPGTDAVRTSGTFNFTLGYSIWCGFMVALIVGEWMQPRSQRCFKSTLTLLICTMSALVATLVSGSRTAVVVAALGFFGGFMAAVITRRIKLITRFGTVMVALPLLALIAYLAAPVSFMGNLERFTSERDRADVHDRLGHMVFGFITQPKHSLLGQGIGTGIQAANVGSVDPYSVHLSEDESGRIVQEIGSPMGIGLTLLRYASAVLLIFAAFKVLLLPGGRSFPHAMPLAFSIAPTLMFGDVVRTAPIVATQTFFGVALICSALLFRDTKSAPYNIANPRMR